MKCNQYFSWWCSTPIKAGPWSWIHASVHKENHSSLTASTASTAFTASTASTHCVLHGVAYCMGVHFTVWPFCTNGGDLFAHCPYHHIPIFTMYCLGQLYLVWGPHHQYLLHGLHSLHGWPFCALRALSPAPCTYTYCNSLHGFQFPAWVPPLPCTYINYMGSNPAWVTFLH